MFAFLKHLSSGLGAIALCLFYSNAAGEIQTEKPANQFNDGWRRFTHSPNSHYIVNQHLAYEDMDKEIMQIVREKSKVYDQLSVLRAEQRSYFKEFNRLSDEVSKNKAPMDVLFDERAKIIDEIDLIFEKTENPYESPEVKIKLKPLTLKREGINAKINAIKLGIDKKFAEIELQRAELRKKDAATIPKIAKLEALLKEPAARLEALKMKQAEIEEWFFTDAKLNFEEDGDPETPDYTDEPEMAKTLYDIKYHMRPELKESLAEEMERDYARLCALWVAKGIPTCPTH